jgi:hypothetical protein
MKSLITTKKILPIAIVSAILLSGILVITPKEKIEQISSAVQGSLQWQLTPNSSDVFNCGGRNDCSDDQDPVFDESQHKYTAQAYDKFGFPLSGVKYKWMQHDEDDIIKFRELNPAGGTTDQSETTAAEIDQEIYVQPNKDNIQNGKATVEVLGYIGDEEQGKTQSIDVDLYFCLNAWPNVTTFPFSDNIFNPYTNFETFYCKDRGNIVNPNDDYAALKIVERANKLLSGGIDDSYLCSGGGGDSLKCDKDYFIIYGGGAWTKDSLSNYFGGIPNNVSSPDAVGLRGAVILAAEGNQWALYNGAWTSGNLTTSFPSIIPSASWPNGPTGARLKPTALALRDGGRWILIEGNFYAKNDPGNLLPTSSTTNLAEAGWPTDVQFPDDIAWWSNGGNNYLLALKGNYYRIYSKNNLCNTDSKCETPQGRKWGSCSSDSECYWGESFNLFQTKEWPTSIAKWQDNIKFPIKTVSLSGGNVITTSSCEYSRGICLLKEFLLITNPACSDGIDNDNDLATDYPADIDCTGPNDNSESGTCDDGIDNDNDGSTDYPDDFSCNAYDDIEEDGCIGTECCDNIDNDGDGLVDQEDGGCDDKTDNTETNACVDGLDNDSDGITDLTDPGCIDSLDNDERGITQCDDGLDNEGDGASDYPDDFGCDRPGDDQELNNGVNQCNDGIDNDSDTFIDQDDPNCADWMDNDES